MSLQLFFSNDVDCLARELSTALSGVWSDPLRPPALLVPNRHVEKWLKLHISRDAGVCMGLSGEFIEKFLWRVLVGDGEEGGPQLIDGPLLQQAILHVMRECEETKRGGDLEDLRQYLHAGAAAGRVNRRIGLAARLAGLFLEYEYSRPDLYDMQGVRRFDGLPRAWPARDYFAPGDDAPAHAMERWQRALYGLAMRTIRTSLGERYVTLPGALAGDDFSPAKIAARAGARGLDRPAFLFGVSGIGMFHRQALLGLSLAVDVHVFTLNPCSAFWEDVDTTRREMHGRIGTPRRRGRVGELTFGEPMWRSIAEENWDERTVFDADAAADNGLLQRWGHAGKENIALWCQAVDYQFNEQYVDNFGGSVLGEVKRSILLRLTSAEQRRAPETGGDSSLVVFKAPGVRREVETMRDYLLEAMRTDATLRPGDIGVFVTGMDDYRAALHEILDAFPPGHARHIPWRIADEKGTASLFCKAVTGILDLMNGEFGRSAVFAFLRSPLVAASCGVDEAAIDTWEGWAVGLNVSHGMDRLHREQLGENDPSPQHTWGRAFERLLLGRLCDTDVDFDDTDDAEEIVRPYLDIDSRDTELCALFARTVEALFRDVNSIVGQQTWRDAAQRLAAVIRAWTAFPDDLGAEEGVAAQYLEGLSLLETRDALAGGSRFDPEEFRQLAVSLADFESAARGNYLTGNLTVAEIRTSRAIPFRIVYVLGMNEGAFPGGADRDTLDLRTWRHIPGDLRPYRQRQYAFLELLACAGERLVLSFNGRDLAKDAELLPCSTVFELQSFVNNAIMETPGTFVFTDVPLLAEGEGDAEADRPSGGWVPPAYSDEVALLLPDATVVPAGGSTASVSDASVTDASVTDASVTDARISAATENDSPEHGDVVTYATTQLAAFLRNPLEFTLKRGMGLADEDDAAPPDDAEPFGTGTLVQWGIKKRFGELVCDELFGAAEGPVPGVKPSGELEKLWETLLRRAYDDAVIDGSAPEGVFAEYDRFGMSEDAIAMAEALAGIAREKHAGGWMCRPALDLRPGAGASARPYVELPMTVGRRLRISSPPRRVFVDPRAPHAVQALVVCFSGATVELPRGASEADPAAVVKRKHLLETMLFAIASIAAGTEPVRTALFVGLDKTGVARRGQWSLDLDPGAARAYLADLATCMEDRARRFDHLPFEIIESIAMNGASLTRESVEEAIEEDEEKAEGKLYRCDLEALHLADKYVPGDPLCADLVRSRFQHLWGAIAQEAGDDA